MTARRPTALLVAIALLPASIAGAAAAAESAQLRTEPLVVHAPTGVLRTPVGNLDVGRVIGLRDVRSALRAHASEDSAGRADALATALLAAAALLVAGVVLAWLVARRAPEAAPAGEDRDVLVRACIDVADTVDSLALRRRLRDALAAAGVEAVEGEDGAPFDAARQHAVDRVPTRDPALRDRLAGTARPGYVDRGRVLRAADVLVYGEARNGR